MPAAAHTNREGSLAAFIWRYEARADRAARPQSASISKESIALSRDLRKHGWKFVGPTTVYAFMQAMGLINDHVEDCVIRARVERAQGLPAARALSAISDRRCSYVVACPFALLTAYTGRLARNVGRLREENQGGCITHGARLIPLNGGAGADWRDLCKGGSKLPAEGTSIRARAAAAYDASAASEVSTQARS